MWFSGKSEYIPFYKVKGLITACRETGISVFPWISEFIPEISTFDDRRPHPMQEYQGLFGEDYLANLPSRYWISPGGRALETFGRFAPQKSVAELVATSSRGCAELTEVSHFHIDLFGNYVPGLCAGLSIRREDLGEPLGPDQYPIISRLYSKGIGGFLAYVAGEYGFVASRPAYASKCDLCYEVRRYLVVDKDVDSHELQPGGHYLYG